MPSFINKQTTLDLNGPVLSFTTHPSSVSACTSGIVTFVGIATATFPSQDPPNPATGTGYISYRWHWEGYGELSDGDLQGTTIVGSATTTLTLSGISSTVLFNNSKFFLRADYIPSAYVVSGSDVTAGTARSTGNAVNDPKDSDVATLNVFPDIEIKTQPGMAVSTTPLTQYASLRITDNLGNSSIVDTFQLSSYSNFISGREYTIVSNIDLRAKIYAVGGGGGTSTSFGRIVVGGSGGAAQGEVNILANKDYKIIVGGGSNSGTAGYGGGGNGNGGGGGGGYTGLFISSISQENAILIAGGGGGGANDPATGGDGGDLIGKNAGNAPGRGGTGGTQTAGGSGYGPGSALQGGSGAGGGGGGYFGGAGGTPFSGCCADGAGGGGSGYLHPYLVTEGSFSSSGSAGGGSPEKNGSFKIEFLETIIQSSADKIAAQGSTAYFHVEASTSDITQGDVSYQWQLNEVDLVDGINTLSIPKNNNEYTSDALLRIPLWDKNSGSLVLEDLTNFANTVTASNLSWVSGTGKFYNGYANFSSNSFIDLRPLSDFNFGYGDFTVETWVYFTQTGYNDIFSTGTYGQNQFSIRKNKDSQLVDSPGSEQLEVYYGSTIIASGGQFNLNTWHHIAVTRQAPFTANNGRGESRIRLFIDGIQVASAVFDGNIRATDVKIGRTPGNTYNMVGRMQDFQVYASARYTSNFIPSNIALVDKRLVLSLPLWDNGTGTLNLTDLSNNPKSITPGSTWGRSPSWIKNVGKFYGGSAFFDGYSYLNLPISNDFDFGTGDFTIELWFNPQKGLRTDSGSFGGVGGWEVLVNAGGGVYFQENNRGGGTWFALSRSTPLNDSSAATFYLADHASYTSIGQTTLEVNKWYHLALSRNSSDVKFFVNGRLVQSTPISNWSNQKFGGLNVGYIGVEHWGGYHERGYYFPFCYMQDLRIYKGVAKYTNPFTPDETSMVTGFSETVTVETEVSGSQTPDLSISLPNVSKNLVRAKISHPTACNSPVYSNTIQFDVVSSINRAVVEVEYYQPNSTIAVLKEFDLKNINYTVTSDIIDSDTICFYAKDRDLYVEMDMYAAKGSDSGKYVGGEGGYSKIRFTMKKNEEFILKGIKTKTALYLYRKGQLIACVGQGGSSGSGGNGGRGGGVGVSGENGFGKLPGNGGVSISSGQLSGNGIFGSSSTATLIYPEDSKASIRNGGRTISCTKGVYWRQQGKASCQDLGNVKFKLSDGTEVTNSASIQRGFKDGYGINQTAGKGDFYGGNGGNGATGGSGGSDGSGGGGGSGYTDTSVTVINSTLGGNNSSLTKVVLKLYEVLQDFYIDDKGRILVLSVATPGKDPRTLTKTTGRVLPGTDSCIDDIRWQRFLDLALTQDYRLTATIDGGKASTKALPFNIRRMINANSIPLKRSLTDWENTNYGYLLLALAWDETNIGGARGYGGDYSILSYAPGSYYFGYYGESSNAFFDESRGIYGYTTANYWILPPGVPDFP
jgi:hypothetical protein